MLIKSMPQEERPLEKAINGGVQALSNTELLGLIIHTGTRNVSSLHLAEEVLSSGNRQPLRPLHHRASTARQGDRPY